MKILFLNNNFRGLFSFRREVIKSLLDKGYDITISAPLDEKIDYFKNLGCKLIDTSFNRRGKNPFKDILLLFKYIKIIRNVKPDVVLTYTIKPNLYGGMACAFLNKKQLANVTGLGEAVEKKGWLQILTIMLYKIGLRKTNTIFFQNKANMDFCIKHEMVKGKKILLPGSGVNLDFHTYQEYPKDDAFKFLFIGRVIYQKGIEQYLEAAKVIKEKYKNSEFHIIGRCDGPYEDKIKELEKDKVIIYHGVQQDVRPFYRMCHCTVHPSFYPEGMSNVLLESCATGRPIITTNRPGCGEIVDVGINGFVVKQEDSNDLIEKIDKFINLPYEKKREMGMAARKKVEESFSRQRVIDAYLREIESLTPGPSPGERGSK